MPLLDINKLTIRFGGLTAVEGLDLQVQEGQIFSIIGPNGAGKTTVFNAITGIYEPTSGNIRLNGRKQGRPLTWNVMTVAVIVGLLTGVAGVIVSVNPDRLWRASVKQTASTDRAFSWARAAADAWSFVRAEPGLERQRNGKWNVVTADGTKMLATADNEDAARTLKAGLVEDTAPAISARTRELWFIMLIGGVIGCLGTLAVWRRSRRTPEVIARSGVARTFQNIRLFQNMSVLENVRVAQDQATRIAFGSRLDEGPLDWLEFVGLSDKAGQTAKDLCYGDQRRLEIARALATRPKLLLLDEPAAGMNPSEATRLMELIRRIRDTGVTVLLIEHHMAVVMGISDRIAVLNYGVKIAEGTPAEVRDNPRVIEAYLGKEEVA